MCILLGCKRSADKKDGVAIAVEGHHDVLVAAASPGLKSACVICEETVEGELVEFDTVGFAWSEWNLEWC